MTADASAVDVVERALAIVADGDKHGARAEIPTPIQLRILIEKLALEARDLRTALSTAEQRAGREYLIGLNAAKMAIAEIEGEEPLSSSASNLARKIHRRLNAMIMSYGKSPSPEAGKVGERKRSAYDAAMEARARQENEHGDQ